MNDQRYAIVTGGAAGLGRAFCLQLARDGWHVAIVDVDAAGSEETRSLVEQAGGRGRVEVCDVTSPSVWQALRDRLQADWPRLDLLVNNAGMFAAARVGELDMADAERVIRLNLLSVLAGCNTMVPWLTVGATGSASAECKETLAKPVAPNPSVISRPTADSQQLAAPHIINVASSFAFLCPPGMSVYNLTKAAVVALSETLYSELRPRGVGVTVVCPGPMPTQFVDRASFGSPALRTLSDNHVRRATLDPAAVAAAALRAAGRQELYVVAGADQRWYWRLKRLLPTAFLRKIGRRVHRQLANLTPNA